MPVLNSNMAYSGPKLKEITTAFVIVLSHIAGGILTF